MRGFAHDDYGFGEFNTSTGGVDTSKNNGQIGKVVGTIGSTTQWLQGFRYDELGRLSNVAEYQDGSMSSQTYSHSYTFDRYGNRFQSANSTLGLIGVSSSEIDATTNRFISSGSTPTTYDAAGNITQDKKFRWMNYSYDANGRMTSVGAINHDGYQTAVYDCAGQRVQTTSNAGMRTMLYDVFGQLVAEYSGTSGATLERENIYRGGQLLAVYEPAASCYMSISQFVPDFYQGALGRSPNSTEQSQWESALAQAQAQGASQLIVAAQNLGTTLFTSTEYANRNRTNGEFVTDLYAGYLQRSPDSGGYDYWMATLNGGATRDQVRNGFAYSTEFQTNVSRLCTSTSSTSASIKYVLTDVQGTTRAVMNNNGSSSAVVSRHDFLPFGEEIWAGIGSRSTSQAYAATNAIRQKYGLTERDDATGLDHTWWRKYEGFSGRWTSPDPYLGSMTIASPQSFNRFAYVQNDPVNFVDPTGLDCWARYLVTTYTTYNSDGEIISQFTTWHLLYIYCNSASTPAPPTDVPGPQTPGIRTQRVTIRATAEQVRKANLRKCLAAADEKMEKAGMAEVTGAANPLNVSPIPFLTGVGVRISFGASAGAAGAVGVLTSQASKGGQAYWSLFSPSGFISQHRKDVQACHAKYGY